MEQVKIIPLTGGGGLLPASDGSEAAAALSARLASCTLQTESTDENNNNNNNNSHGRTVDPTGGTGSPVQQQQQPVAGEGGNGGLFLLPANYFSDLESVDFASGAPESSELFLRQQSQHQSFAGTTLNSCAPSVLSLTSGDFGVNEGCVGGAHHSASFSASGLSSTTSNVQVAEDGYTGEFGGFLSSSQLGGCQSQQQHHQYQHNRRRSEGQTLTPSNLSNSQLGAPPPPHYGPSSPFPMPQQSASQRRNQGYRKLFQQVTKVSKGQKLTDSESGAPYTDMTVEDILRIVFKLAPQESTIAAVEKGLYYLDSSATAALLKELSKQGQLKRAVDIFDWLRGLPSGHELSHLCDLYTYTTMISQCGSHQQLRRALELVAEMRSRGIECNVHTYSALMNVCIKANELDLGQDVYRQMLEEGIAPNLVTYNILIDVFVKRGQWEEAIKTLDRLEGQGIQAEVRTYNTVISACNKSGQPEHALQIYERMLSAGVKPSATTYTALISAYGRAGKIDNALEIFQDMIRRGCERNVITYSSLISACEKAGRWELALELFNKMHKENCKPNVVTYNSLIAACAHGGHWEKATEFFQLLQAQGCKPDSITFSALIAAFEKGGQWRRALKALEQMQASGCHPDAAVFNSMMEVLWQSGVILAQVKALQLWSLANRNGQFRIYTNSRQESPMLQYSTVALTTGAAIVTILRWLVELRSKLLKDGPAFFRESVVMTLHKAKQTRSEQPSLVIYEALSSMLLGSGSPFRAQLLDHTITLDTTSAALIVWLGSPSFAELVFLVQGGSIRRMTLDMVLSEDVTVAARCMDAFDAIRRLEDATVPNMAMYNAAVLQQRPQVVHLALKYGVAFAFREDTVYDGLMLFDRVMCCGVVFNPNLWPLCLCSCILLSARQGEAGGTPGWPNYDSIALLTGFGADALLAMEHNVRGWLRGDTSGISAQRVVQLYEERLGHYLQEFKPAHRTAKEMPALLVKAAASPACIGVRPSVLAAAVLAVLRSIKGIIPAWPVSLQLMTNYSLASGELPACMLHVESLLQSV